MLQVLQLQSSRIRGFIRWLAPLQPKAAWRWSGPVLLPPLCSISAVLASVSWCLTALTSWTSCHCRRASVRYSTINWVGFSVSTAVPQKMEQMDQKVPHTRPFLPWRDRLLLRVTQRVLRPTPKPVRGKGAAGLEWTSLVLPCLKHWQRWLSCVV